LKKSWPKPLPTYRVVGLREESPGDSPLEPLEGEESESELEFLVT